jgi:hypothetical protein
MNQQFYAVWDDLRFPATGINPAGAVTDPSVDTVLTSFPGTLLFSGTVENVVSIIAQMPHGWLAGSDVHPHIHWSKPTGSASPVSWELYYRIIGGPGTAPSAWSSAIPGTLVRGVQIVSNEHLISSFGGIYMGGLRESAILNLRLHRLGNTDLESNDVRLYELDLHYQKSSHGSIPEYPGA